MIEAIHLKKTYKVKAKEGLFVRRKKEIEAVKDISLQIEKGKIVGLLGLNGAGKTTTIKMLTTLLSPTSGTYTFDGIDAVKNPMLVKQQINMIAGGERMLYWRLTAYENLWYYGQIYGVPKECLRKRIQELLSLVGLEGKANIPVETFSKGMKQRLQIARGLINNPQYLFMDEPTIGLDAVVSKELRSHVKYLASNQEKGILLTSHYLGEIEELCDYIYILNEGRLMKEGTSQQLAAETFQNKLYILKLCNGTEYTMKKMKEELQKYDPAVSIAGNHNDLTILSKENLSLPLSKLCASEGYFVKEMYEKEPSPEDTICKLAKEA